MPWLVLELGSLTPESKLFPTTPPSHLERCSSVPEDLPTRCRPRQKQCRRFNFLTGTLRAKESLVFSKQMTLACVRKESSETGSTWLCVQTLLLCSPALQLLIKLLPPHGAGERKGQLQRCSHSPSPVLARAATIYFSKIRKRVGAFIQPLQGPGRLPSTDTLVGEGRGGERGPAPSQKLRPEERRQRWLGSASPSHLRGVLEGGKGP